MLAPLTSPATMEMRRSGLESLKHELNAKKKKKRKFNTYLFTPTHGCMYHLGLMESPPVEDCLFLYIAQKLTTQTRQGPDSISNTQSQPATTQFLDKFATAKLLSCFHLRKACLSGFAFTSVCFATYRSQNSARAGGLRMSFDRNTTFGRRAFVKIRTVNE